MRTRALRAVSAALVLVLVASACAQQPRGGPASPTAAGLTGEQPKPGGTLVFVVNAEPPTFDAHKETTFAVLHPASPHYSTLLRFDPADLTKVVPDVAAAMPTVSADKLTVTVKLRTDVKFHDGTAMTSEDVLATYNKIVFPPTGVVSARQGTFSAVESLSAPDASTIVFKLKHPSASLITNLASPWNYIYSAAKLKTDIKWYEKNIMGTGPFTHIEYVKGSHWSGRKNPNYFLKDRPYLDSYRAVFITNATAAVNAVRGRQAMIEFRSFTPQQRDDLSRALGQELALQEAPWICVNYIAINSKKAPFDDPRVRRALSLGIDRWTMGENLSKLTWIKAIGGLMRPLGPFAMPDADLQKIAGFGKDAAAAQTQAKALLKEAGAEGLTFKLLNRNIQHPYESIGVYLIDQWKKLGLNVTHDVKETTPYFAAFDNLQYDVGVDFNCDFLDEPDLQLAKFYSASKLGRGLNRSGYDDAKLDDMIAAQSKETDPEKRKKLVWDIERYAMDEKAYQFPVPWWTRIIPHLAIVRGWRIGSNHYTNQDLGSVWLAAR